ncbi:MAG TPA: site-2 protease family protein [Chloroflexia bacterium]|nr:site-2 protease family protein [Chloroflexia bacterium]
MNTGAFKVATIGGVAIKLHWSWLIIFLVLTYSLAASQFPDYVPGETQAFYWVTGAIASLLFFISVLLHELSHSFTARALGYQVREIILFIFGGVSNIEQEPKRARDEFFIAVVGPLASFVIAGIAFLLLQVVTPPIHREGAGAAAILQFIAFTNALLGIFNMIPGFPLDGGRVLRSIVWGLTHNFGTATRVAGLIGQIVAYILIGLGLFQVFYSGNLGGLWTAFIGWFLLNAAQESVSTVAMRETFRGIYVRDLMENPPATIQPTATLAHLLSLYVIPQSLRSVYVADSEGKVVGIITLGDIKEVPQDRWGIATVGEYMVPIDKMRTVVPSDGLDRAIGMMSQDEFDQLPVLDPYGRLAGILTKARIIRWLQVRDEMKQRS